jgi:hypothetical protein
MEPLTIYVSFAALLIVFSLAVRIFKISATRLCHLCGTRVELGRQRCPACDYRFIN